MLILQYKVSFTYDRLSPRLRFLYIYACIVVFLYCYRFSVNKDLYYYNYYAKPSPTSHYAMQYCDYHGAPPSQRRSLMSHSKCVSGRMQHRPDGAAVY